MADPVTIALIAGAAASATGAGVSIARAVQGGKGASSPPTNSRIAIPPPSDTVDTAAILRERQRRLKRQTTIEDLRASQGNQSSITDAGIRIPRA